MGERKREKMGGSEFNKKEGRYSEVKKDREEGNQRKREIKTTRKSDKP
jgi:hypothetical protein